MPAADAAFQAAAPSEEAASPLAGLCIACCGVTPAASRVVVPGPGMEHIMSPDGSEPHLVYKLALDEEEFVYDLTLHGSAGELGIDFEGSMPPGALEVKGVDNESFLSRNGVKIGHVLIQMGKDILETLDDMQEDAFKAFLSDRPLRLRFAVPQSDRDVVEQPGNIGILDEYDVAECATQPPSSDAAVFEEQTLSDSKVIEEQAVCSSSAPEKLTSDLNEEARRSSEQAKKLWQKASQMTSILSRMILKVDMENKIGTELTGWHHDAALALQRGISPKTRPSDFEAPAEELFERMRKVFGFKGPRYAATLGLLEGQKTPSLRLVASSAAAGKSGAFFFLSPDQQLIAKSCSEKEWDLLLGILPAYVEHVEKAPVCSPRLSTRHESAAISTLLPGYMGLYAFFTGEEKHPQKKVRILVMTNVFAGVHKIDRRYDLKGSTSGRLANAKELKKQNPVYKDLDWLKSESGLKLGDHACQTIISAIDADVTFLAAQGLMDYSLLVGLHMIRPHDSVDKREIMNVTVFEDLTRICYIGIVDILTLYNWRKAAETWLGRLTCRTNVSCQPPERYADRMVDFVRNHIFVATE